MFLIKKVLVYLEHRQEHKKRLERQKRNKEQIALILQDLI